MSNRSFNPLLVHAMTNAPLDEIAVFPLLKGTRSSHTSSSIQNCF